MHVRVRIKQIRSLEFSVVIKLLLLLVLWVKLSVSFSYTVFQI